MKTLFKWIERIALVIFICVFAFSAYKLFGVHQENEVEEKEVNTIKEEIKVPDPKEEKELETFTIDWDYVKDRYPNVVGWIVVEDTSISYPICQASDNDYYLDHTYAGTSNYAGSIFLDYRASSDFTDRNTFIYGHNVYHGTMFAELKNYMKADFFNAHPYVYLYTRNGNYKLQVFSAYIDKTTSAGYQMFFSSDEEYANYLDVVQSKSLYNTDVTVTSADQIVSLYTCSYESGNNPDNTDADKIDDRYYIHCKLIYDLDNN